MKRILLLSLLLLSLEVFAASKRVLWIGNSYTEVNDLPQMTADIAKNMGNVIDFSSYTPGGCTFEQHCSNMSMTLICNGGWDVVVLQEQSQLPSFPQSQVEVECFPYAARLVDSVYAHNPNGEAMFYMTWGRKDGDQANAKYFPVLGTYEGMDSMLYERYMQMAADNDASVSPVGRVWRYLRTNEPDLELYAGDGSHPSLAGSYAAACTFHTMFFGDDPSLITTDLGLDSKAAAAIRAAVKIVVFDNISQWQRQQQGGDDDDDDDDDDALDEVSLASLFSPNPASSVIVMDGDGRTVIYDINGAALLESENSQIDVSFLPEGVYFVSRGKHTEKLIINR